ncbi:MAG: hypothetical protein UD936_11460, partial [Acutalibacteraceae bacterium]|nr:hypothetical protein [Acutalibacteraceae bacterium]
MSDETKMDFSASINEARKKRVESFKLNVELDDSDKDIVEEADDVQENLSDSNEDSSAIDSSASSRIMADDFSEKYSLHKYTDANQIEDNEEFIDIEQGNTEKEEEENEIEEISSFSNAEQKHKMDKEERKALREFKKADKKRK